MRGYQVLVVEDDAASRQLLTQYLGARGVEVRTAGDGETAWRLFQEAPPQVVLTDLMLPWVSGAELVHRIRAHAEHGNVPVVVMTAACASRERAREVLGRLPVQDAFSKPLALEELLSCLDALVALGPAATPRHAATECAPEGTLPAVDVWDPADATPAATPLHSNRPRTLCALAVRLFEAHATTVLTIREKSGLRRLLFADGLVVGAETSVPAESLAGSLRAEGVLDAQLAAQAGRIMMETGVGFPLAVQRVLGVDPWVVAAAMERNVRRVVWRALCATDGEYSVAPWGVGMQLQITVAMDPVRAVQEAALRVLAPAALEDVLSALHGCRVFPGVAFEQRCAVLATVAPRSTVPLLVQASAQLGGAVPDVATLGEVSRRQLAALLLCGAVTTHERVQDAVARRSAVLESGEDWGLCEPMDLAARNVVALEVLRTHQVDAYAVLQVARDANREQRVQGVRAHGDRLGPPALDGENLGPARPALDIMRGKRRTSWGLLSDGDKRPAYDAFLQGKNHGRTPTLRFRALTRPPPPPLESLGPHVGPYLLLERMAVGGAAEIFLGKDTRSGATVVLKRLRPERELDITVVTGFIRESELAMMMKHPNLLSGLDRGMEGDAAWLALEYVEGLDLDHLLNRVVGREGVIPPALSLHIVRQMLDGLFYAHTLTDMGDAPLGLVHRDLAPRNVLLGMDGVVKVADFGGSVFTLTELAAPEVVGSAGFLSPEQARLEPLDARSDLFAVGCILYQLLTGGPAFNLAGADDATVLSVHQEGRIQPVPADLPHDQRLLVEIACAADREDRYPDAAAMRDAADRAVRALGGAAGPGELAAVLREVRGRAA